MSDEAKRHSKATVELTQRAIADLRTIEKYSIKEWGRKTAAKYIDDIATALDLISDDPGILCAEPGIPPGMYFYRVKKHYLVCDYRENKIIVLTILHTSMDLPTRLLEFEPRLEIESQFLQRKLRKDPDAD